MQKGRDISESIEKNATHSIILTPTPTNQIKTISSFRKCGDKEIGKSESESDEEEREKVLEEGA